MRNKSNEDYNRHKTRYEQVIQPHLDSNEYQEKTKNINDRYFDFRNQLPKDLIEKFDNLMTELNSEESEFALISYILGFEEGKSFNNQSN